MPFTTYAELQTAIAGWLARDDLTAPIVDFITLSELHLQRRLRALDTETTDTMVTVAGTATVALPDRFVTARSLWIDDHNPLEFRTPNQGNFEYEDYSAQPRVYSIVGSNFHFWPTPDAVYTINRIYMAYPQPLSDSNTSNAWLTEIPDGLLFGALVESAPYIGQDARLPLWEARRDRAIMEFERKDQDKRYPMAGLVPRPDRRVY